MELMDENGKDMEYTLRKLYEEIDIKNQELDEAKLKYKTLKKQ
jgi:hypothetical protein